MKNTKSLIVYIENGKRTKIFSVSNYGCLLELGLLLKEYYSSNSIEFLFNINYLKKYNINQLEYNDEELLKEDNYDLIYTLNESKISINVLNLYLKKIFSDKNIKLDLLEAIERFSLNNLFRRYYKFIKANENLLNSDFVAEDCKYSNLLRLVEEANFNGSKYPTDKLHRWLGYTQGVLISYGILNVNEERDYSRPFLHSFHLESINSF